MVSIWEQDICIIAVNFIEHVISCDLLTDVNLEDNYLFLHML